MVQLCCYAAIDASRSTLITTLRCRLTTLGTPVQCLCRYSVEVTSTLSITSEDSLGYIHFVYLVLL